VGPVDFLAAVTPLSRAEAALRRIVTDLRQLGRRFALVGGLAVSARTEPRLTRDADLAVLVTDDRDAENLVRDLQERDWRVLAAVEQEAAGRLATVRLVAAGEDVHGAVVDLLFASSGIEPEIVAAADPIEVVPGFGVPIARLGHLVALKVLARDDRTRPYDRVDLAALLGRADAAMLEEARESLALVMRRGFHRARDLLAALEAAMREFRG
jgi:Nucleotidyl transferase AbiEii toxin, Type IV TA system